MSPPISINIKLIQLKAELEREYKNRRVSKHSPKRLNQNNHTPSGEHKARQGNDGGGQRSKVRDDFHHPSGPLKFFPFVHPHSRSISLTEIGWPETRGTGARDQNKINDPRLRRPTLRYIYVLTESTGHKVHSKRQDQNANERQKSAPANQ